ncbi:hypothetical protein [Saccharomonospora azurea]|uniref:hypothetical protein n=1 Tax=Saccharomonospora azurea TaxID=40988 RepID=UPI00022DEEE1
MFLKPRMMERRRRGLVTKPTVVVPNDSIAEQFERQWLQAYPNARLLTAGSAELADDKKKGRNGRAEFVARVATGDWDAVIITKEAFQRIPLPEDAQEDFLRAELDALEVEKRSHIDSLGPSMTKRLENAMESAEQRLQSRLAEIERDVQGMTLADAGVDYLVVDEAQNYKNGMVNSAIPDLAIEGAHRSIDLDMKLAWLQKQHGSARVVLATATPWTGKFSEVYLWLRRLGHDLPRFDAWARTFVTSASYMEMTPGGTLRPKTRTRGTINEPELWRQIRLTSDVKMQADLRLGGFSGDLRPTHGTGCPQPLGEAAVDRLAAARVVEREVDRLVRETCMEASPGSWRRSQPAICSGDQHRASLASTSARRAGRWASLAGLGDRRDTSERCNESVTLLARRRCRRGRGRARRLRGAGQRSCRSW